MTMFKPTLIVNALIVFKNGNPVFECKLHKGVNIISGHNSSGKTTILDFISYTLGAENIPWKEKARLCDSVLLEVSLNDNKITLRRDVNQKPLNPLSIYWGNLNDALKASFNDWEVFPFKRSTNKISFTQAILNALDVSESQGDGASNLTMHQFLRVLYADQPSLHSPIFRSDSFDTALNRETIGNYLCGFYNDDLYSAQLEKRNLDKQIEQLASELRSIFSVLARSEQDVSLDFFSASIESAETQRNIFVGQLQQLKSEGTLDKKQSNQSEVENSLRKELNNAKKSLNDTLQKLTNLELEIADSEKFIDEIKFRLKSIEESTLTRDFLGSIDFSFCPCCLNEITHTNKDESLCSLCKSSIGDIPEDNQALRMKNELRVQLHESTLLLDERFNTVREINSEIPNLKQKLKRLEQRYKDLTSTWSTELEFSIEDLARKIGSLDQEIKSLYEQQKLSIIIEELQTRRKSLENRLIEVNAIIERLEFSQEQRKVETQYKITETLGRLLRQDLYRQEEFRNPDQIAFSFSDNQISVQGATKFSESSTVVLRHLFHIALLSASTKLQYMRLPRFIMLDGIEDGGMELERSHLLQEIIVKECESFEVDYQLIIASSQISPTLDKTKYIVGRTFTEEKRSLNIL